MKHFSHLHGSNSTLTIRIAKSLIGAYGLVLDQKSIVFPSGLRAVRRGNGWYRTFHATEEQILEVQQYLSITTKDLNNLMLEELRELERLELLERQHSMSEIGRVERSTPQLSGKLHLPHKMATTSQLQAVVRRFQRRHVGS